MKNLAFFILTILSHAAYAQCCEFEIAYHPEVQEVPSLSDLESCSNNKLCDPRYYLAGKMIHAMREDDIETVDSIFEELITVFSRTPATDILTLEIIYTYARYLTRISKGTQALAYYKFVQQKSSKGSLVELLSSIAINGQNGNSDEILKSLKDLPNNYISNSDKVFTVLKSASFLDNDASYKTLKEYEYPHKNDATSFLYLMHRFEKLNYNNDPESNEIWGDLMKSTFDPETSLFAYKWLMLQSTKLSYSEEYNKALAIAKKNVELRIGSFDTNRELLEKPLLTLNVPPYILGNYAHTTLYQTRLGKGLPPVIDAFNIYETSYLHRIKRRTLTISTIFSENDISTVGPSNDILVIGTYLYQKTNNIEYLNRAYSIISGMTSGGAAYWSSARALMRKSNSFRKDILEEQRLVAAVRKTDIDDTLREIYNRQSKLEAFRKQNENEYEYFYDQVTESYSVDLESTQEQMQRDTAACINFFLAPNMLYRLYVSPDTIDIFPIGDKARVKSLELIEQLAKMTESGKSAKAMEAASRELYGYLFQGIEEKLPPKLHIMANGKLLDLPFSVLRQDAEGESPRYLGVEHAISHQFSLSAMRLLEETELNPSYAQPLAMAPSFANEFLQASELRQAGFLLPPLVYNTEELNDLESRGGGEYLYEDDATIGRYRDEVSDYNIIHLATHAISSEADGLRSRVYLLDDDGEPVGLYAGDIGEQTLNSELVVLSACETGGGTTHFEEGRIGLTKAYLAAGARSVVASNWAVDDHATAEQMKTFYDGIEAGQPPHVALQGARRAYVEAHPDAAPYKWAAFEAYGGMKPVRWDKKAEAGNWWWLALPILGLGATVVWNKRRRNSRAA